MTSNALVFISLCAVSLAFSFSFDRRKTLEGLKRGWKMLRNVLLPFVDILIIVSLLLYLISPELISRYLGADSGPLGFSLAAVIGSVTIIPGFISYPIAAGLIRQGASYAVVATFMTTLMMVGVVTLPLEIRYFGKKVAILRNALNFVAAIAIGLLVGLVMQGGKV